PRMLTLSDHWAQAAITVDVSDHLFAGHVHIFTAETSENRRCGTETILPVISDCPQHRPPAAKFASFAISLVSSAPGQCRLPLFADVGQPGSKTPQSAIACSCMLRTVSLSTMFTVYHVASDSVYKETRADDILLLFSEPLVVCTDRCQK
ncbi:hypothetical protein BaRGS_00018102, partial [Batillaria attramentaria]